MNTVNSAEGIAARPLSDLASLRRVWTLAGEHRRAVVFGLCFRFAQSAFLGLAFAMAVHAVTVLAGGETPSTGWIVQVTMVLAVSLLGQLGCGYWAMRLTWLASFAVGRNLRQELLDHLRRVPLGFHLSRGRGDILSVLTADTQLIESFFSDGLPRIAQAVGLPLALLVFFAFYQPAVAVMASISILAGLPLFVWSSRALAGQAIQRQDRQAEATAKMIEYVRGMPVIKSFNRLASSRSQFDEALSRFRDISILMVRQLAVPMVAFGAIIVLGVPILIAFAGFSSIGGTLDRGTTLSVLMLAFSFYVPLLGLVTVMEHVRMADASLARVSRILEQRPLPVMLPPVKPQGTDISFEEVGFSYSGERPTLTDVTFHIPERTVTAIVGPSGSGKTTLMNLVSRIFDVSEGKVRIGGVDVRQLSEEQVSDLVTLVFQDVFLFSGTIAENIAIARPGASRADIEDAARLAQAHDFISALPGGYETRVGEGGSALSGGERQRVSIARALLKGSPIVLLDEATSSVDPLAEQGLLEAMRHMARTKTVIVVAHKLATIVDADMILVLENGALVQKGRHRELSGMDGCYRHLLMSRERAERWRL